MNKFIKNVSARPTGNYSTYFSGFVCFETNGVLDTTNYVIPEYRIEVKMGCIAKVDPRNINKSLHLTINKTRRILLEEMFGEFRKPILEISLSLLNRDIQKAIELTDKLYDQMFSLE